jgi:glycine betaine/proline transport system substrate-binding protein
MTTKTTAKTAGFAAALTLATAISLTPAWAEVESKDPIKLTLHDWTGQLITTRIMGEVLKKAGYNIEYVQADYIAQFAGLKTGDLHVAMEIWETTGREAMDEATATGNVENLARPACRPRRSGGIPTYMKEKCPGLPNWEALKDEKCAEAFSTAETAPKGRYLGGPVTWGGYDDERVEALELPFEVMHAGTDAALFAELEAPISARRRSCCGCMRRTGRRPSTKASGWSFRNTPRNATRCRLGHQPGCRL